MNRPVHRRRLAASFKDHVLVAGLCDYLGIPPNEARIAMVLYRAARPLAPFAISQRAGCAQPSVKVYVSHLRYAMDPGAFVMNNQDGLYAMTPSGRAEMRTIFRAIRDAVDLELGLAARLQAVR